MDIPSPTPTIHLAPLGLIATLQIPVRYWDLSQGSRFVGQGEVVGLSLQGTSKEL